jgi:RNA polymerase sigma-70 factor (ECF subfamily)
VIPLLGFPDTRYSLIARLERLDDEEAWREFLALYEPVVYRIARRRGLQHADAEDLSQRVFASVGRAIHNFEPDRSQGKFRSWLARIAQNATINMLTRRPFDAATGGTSVFELLEGQLGKEECPRDVLGLEFRRSLFRWTAERIRGEYRETTWRAFWLTTLEGRDIATTAAELGMSLGSVYVARSRIVRRLKNEIEAHASAFQDHESDHVEAPSR